MTEPQDNTQGEGLGSEHGKDPEGCKGGRRGDQDDHSGPLGPDHGRDSEAGSPAELDLRRQQEDVVGDGEVLPGLDQDALTRQGFRLQHEHQEFHAGPLPDPATLEAYDRIVPGGAERIFRAMERTIYGEESRRDRALTAAVRTSYIGQVVAALLAVGLVAVAVFFFFKGNNVAGVAFMSVPAVMLVRTFWSPRGEESGD